MQVACEKTEAPEMKKEKIRKLILVTSPFLPLFIPPFSSHLHYSPFLSFLNSRILLWMKNDEDLPQIATIVEETMTMINEANNPPSLQRFAIIKLPLLLLPILLLLQQAIARQSPNKSPKEER